MIIITFFSAGIGLYSKFYIKEVHLFFFHVDSGVHRIGVCSQLASVSVGTLFDKTPGESLRVPSVLCHRLTL